jgi:hypothetical protein
VRTAIIARRDLIVSGGAALLAAALSRGAFAAPLSPANPIAIVTAIYTRAAKGKGDGGGAFIIANNAAKTKYLSKALVALWAKTDAHTPKGDVGPIDFDPVTNSQEPDVKSFKVAPEQQETDKATLAVTIEGRNTPARKPAERTILYELVRDGAEWKIDDIKGVSNSEPWSIRGMLTDSLKS